MDVLHDGRWIGPRSAATILLTAMGVTLTAVEGGATPQAIGHDPDAGGRVPETTRIDGDPAAPIGSGFGKRWVVSPIFSSNPKLGTSVGAMGVLFFQADDRSRSSQAFAQANYSNTDSYIAVAGTRVYWGADRHRFIGGLARGHATNDYEDFLGLGIHLESEADIWATPMLYQWRLGPAPDMRWWIGAQGVYIRMRQAGTDARSDALVRAAALDEGEAAALGPNLLYDSRDNENSPQIGHRFFASYSLWDNLEPRRDQEEHFQAIRAEWAGYVTPRSTTFAANVGTRLTIDAPLMFSASLDRWRAYTVGEQYGEASAFAQTEMRIPFGDTRFGAAVFGGVSALVDEVDDFEDGDRYYPMIGAGLRYVLQEQERMIVRLEYAQGKAGASGVYLAVGQAFQ